MKHITIIDKEYLQWIGDLALRYRQSQIKAAVKVNGEMLRYYWKLGHEIVNSAYENKYGTHFYETLSADLKKLLPSVKGLSASNLRYTKRFYQLYNQVIRSFQQVAEDSESEIVPQVAEDSYNDKALQLFGELFQLPWGHHQLIIDKFSNAPEAALFYVRKSVKEGWSRAVLLNFIDTNLYEREGKAISNFRATLPDAMSDLAQEITKDPYNFAFAEITAPYNEALLKKDMLSNITEFLIELGSGFAYVGKEYRLQIGETENFIDLLFYHLRLRCYVVIEVKMDKFTPGDIGQLSTYVVGCNHILKRADDNPTIGLLVCKSKDNTLAQYALEGTTQPIGISEFELQKLYPQNVEGCIPTIEELERRL